jgi:hypothetical protein
MDGKIIRHPEVNKYLSLGMMCKVMRCLPSEIRKQDYLEIKYLSTVFSELSKKNPMNMFM